MEILEAILCSAALLGVIAVLVVMGAVMRTSAARDVAYRTMLKQLDKSVCTLERKIDCTHSWSWPDSSTRVCTICGRNEPLARM